jgi:hypothetical protein
MDLGELITWASKYDTSKVEQKQNQRGNAVNYLGMIIDKGNAIIRNSKQTDNYMENIKEYLEQLNKIGISPKNTPPPVRETKTVGSVTP